MKLVSVVRGPEGAAEREAAPMVLLHGLFGQARNMGAIQRRLAAVRRVVAFDLRSHGGSPHGAMRFETMAEDVAESLDEAGIGSAVWVGHSLGGKVAMMAALTRPERVARLMVADIAPVAYRHGHRGQIRAMRGLRLRPGMGRAEADAALAEAIAEKPVRDLLLQNLALRARPDGMAEWRVGLDEIEGSIDALESWPEMGAQASYGGAALFLRGGASDYVRDADLPAIVGLFPCAEIETMEGAGHWLHVEQQGRFVDRVGAFASGADRGA